MIKPLTHHEHRTILLVLFCFFILTVQAQTKGSANKTIPGKNKAAVTSTVPQKPTDIYVAGYTYNQKRYRATATYWKNGEAFPLTNGQADSEVTCMTVVGNDVYTAGMDHGQAVYWKNGERFQLTTKQGNYGRAQAITVVGTDVYVAGQERDFVNNSHKGDIARVWKNGEATALPTGGKNGKAQGIAVDHGDVYVVGVGEMKTNGSFAVYWKNGQTVSAINSAFYNPHTITIVNGDVYVMGTSIALKAAYWKNGQTIELPQEKPQQYYNIANSLAIEGNDLYIAGTENGVVKYWKNGRPFTLSEPGDAYNFSSIAVSGNDVYVAGGKFYKNGQVVNLPTGQDDYYLVHSVVLVKPTKDGPKTKTATPVFKKKPVNAPTIPVAPKEEPGDFFAENKKKPGIITTPSGLQYQVISQGSGARPLTSDKVKLNLRMMVKFGNRVLHASQTTEPHMMAVNEWFPGLAEGVKLMNVGGKYKLFIPDYLGYGGLGIKGKEKDVDYAKTVLLFDVELLEIVQ
ncbi:FKBP-type peptidyl-prolyl cis-trans isomerase [Pedobacter frigiditerrae]|uniref:FKBP-type peptidyl-prolyl cis-trans isomerase n=1 Tax=Pedobacter frigiditerrae TaxID=2530452 RepID=UPI00292D511E|nr:FKBP-type peptidyl-prolyl cis-trans isomerase [Pedobacter frigiditerrae]